MLRAAGRCIAGPAEGFVGYRGVIHGPVVSGGRCARCLEAAGRPVAASKPAGAGAAGIAGSRAADASLRSLAADGQETAQGAA